MFMSVFESVIMCTNGDNLFLFNAWTNREWATETSELIPEKSTRLMCPPWQVHFISNSIKMSQCDQQMWFCFDICSCWSSSHLPKGMGAFHTFKTSCTLSHGIFLGILALWFDLGEMNETYMLRGRKSPAYSALSQQE